MDNNNQDNNYDDSLNRRYPPEQNNPLNPALTYNDETEPDTDQWYSDDQPPYEKNDEKSNELCPQCGSELVIKEGALIKYITCSKFPDCNFTTSYDEDNYTNSSEQTQESEFDTDNGESYDADVKSDEQSYYYDEPDEQSDNYEDGLTHPSDEDEQEPEEKATSLPPEPYFQPSIFNNQNGKPEEHEDKKSEIHNLRSQKFSINPSLFINNKQITEGARWTELKKKKLLDQQKFIDSTPTLPGIDDLPSSAEMEETLKKLESNVQNLQEQEDQRLAPPAVPNPHRAQLRDDEDDYFTD